MIRSFKSLMAAAMGLMVVGGCAPASSTKTRTPVAASSTTAAVAGSGTTPTAEAKAPLEKSIGPRPKVMVVGQAEYDFGILQVGGTGKHTFVLRNEGDGELTLRDGGSSCKCTAMKVGGTRLAPGEETTVHLEWKTENTAELFRHGAMLYTNDPHRPRIDLTVIGKVRKELATSVETVLFPDVIPGEPATQTVLVYSQTRNDLAAPVVQSKSQKLTLTVRPADEAALKPLHGLSGHLVEVTLDTSDLTIGSVASEIAIEVDAPAGSDASGKAIDALREILVMPVDITVPGDVAYFGKAVNRDGLLDLGQIKAGQTRRETFFMLVRGTHRDFTVKEVRSQPEHLRVTVTPQEAASTKRARYKVEVEVPADAPAASYLGDQQAEIEIIADDPAVPPMRFNVQFAVF